MTQHAHLRKRRQTFCTNTQ